MVLFFLNYMGLAIMDLIASCLSVGRGQRGFKIFGRGVLPRATNLDYVTSLCSITIFHRFGSKRQVNQYRKQKDITRFSISIKNAGNINLQKCSVNYFLEWLYTTFNTERKPYLFPGKI